MKTDNTIASFWHAYAAADQATKFLSGKSEPLALETMVNATRSTGIDRERECYED